MNQAGRSCEEQGIPGWRQYQFNLRQVKKLFRRTQKVRYLQSVNDGEGLERSEKNKKNDAIYQVYLDRARFYVAKGKQAQQSLEVLGCFIPAMLLYQWITDAERQIDQIDRRVLQGEKIPHAEKVFSIFEPHTEWISKGKAGVPVELGVRVCIGRPIPIYPTPSGDVDRDR